MSDWNREREPSAAVRPGRIGLLPIISAHVFDAYGTLFDLRALDLSCEGHFPGLGSGLGQAWRRKQLEFSWLRTLMGHYADFAAVTESALDSAAGMLNLALAPGVRQALLRGYERLPAYPDVAPALERLRWRPRAIFSNGAPAMLEAVVRHAGLLPLLDHIISVDPVGRFKPDPRAYGLVPKVLGLPTTETLFISSNYWDACGAKAFGFQVAWLNRAGLARDRLDPEPDHEIRSLDELPL